VRNRQRDLLLKFKVFSVASMRWYLEYRLLYALVYRRRNLDLCERHILRQRAQSGHVLDLAEEFGTKSASAAERDPYKQHVPDDRTRERYEHLMMGVRHSPCLAVTGTYS